MSTDISGKKLFIIIICKIFTSDIIIALVNILLPCIVSIHCTRYQDTLEWWLHTIIQGAIIIIFNITSVIIKNVQNKGNRNINLSYKCYTEQCSINNKFANKIYQLNKTINDYITNGGPISKASFDKIADFQTFSFSICESIHDMLRNEFRR